MGVEKLSSHKSVEIRRRQDALQMIFSARLDISIPQISPDLGNIELFNTYACHLGPSAAKAHESRSERVSNRLRGDGELTFDSVYKNQEKQYSAATVTRLPI